MSKTTIESLLLPGTPHEIVEKYTLLTERAQQMDFGPLTDGVVILDTETTGLSFKECELIQIAAARLEEGVVVERFDKFIHPKRGIPQEITRLTGISYADVAEAPTAAEIVAELATFVSGMPVIAHNALFDRTFIEHVAGGRNVSDMWIDTLALSRIALPRLASHRLADMAQAFGSAAVTHRAGDDVDALCGLWPIVLTALTDLPPGLLQLFVSMHPEATWSYRPIMSYLADLSNAIEQPFSLRDIRHDLIATPFHTRADVAERISETEAPSADEIRAAFAENGIVDSLYEDYEDRPEQLAMALEVRDALETHTHKAIEAGTGVGKSIAYLVPEVLFAQKNNITVGVATKTNALTDQLISHELPALAAALPNGLSFTSLKGYEHYPCLRKLERATVADFSTAVLDIDAHRNIVEQEMLTALAVMYAYVCQSPEGDLDALGIRWKFIPREIFTTKSKECLRRNCPFFPNLCLLHGARRRAASVDVVVTNHSLLLRNVEADGKILPPIRNWVVDEAHAFEAEARRQWAVEISATEVRRGFEQLGGLRSGAIHAVMTQVGNLDGVMLHTRLLTKFAAAVARAQIACSNMFDALHGLISLKESNTYHQQIIWIDTNVRSKEEWKALEKVGWEAFDKLEEAGDDLASAVLALAEDSPQLSAELADAGSFLKSLYAHLELILEGEDTSYVYSVEVSRRNVGAQERLIAEKVNVGADLAARWLPEMESVVFSSATIAVGDSFDHFTHAVGLDLLPADEHRELRLSSSFDFDSNMTVVVCRDLPAPGDREYVLALENLLFDIHVSMEGSVLTLFTNRREMEAVYHALSGRLSSVGLTLECQERGSSPRRIRDRFLADKQLSLFALRTFWEGFDAAGDTLRCVVIPKLPFASPNDPLVREREIREERSWWRYSLPEAIISVKQAAGRLIRSKNDSGVLVLADSRLVTKRYGRQFIASLPSTTVAELGSDMVKTYIEMWRRGRGQ